MRKAAFTLVLLCLCVHAHVFAASSTEDKVLQALELKTLKKSYRVGEKITVMFKNPQTFPLTTMAAASGAKDQAITRLERKGADGAWIALDVRCHWPECDIDHDTPSELGMNKSINVEWQPVVHRKNESPADQAPSSGRYRIVSEFQVRHGVSGPLTEPKEWKRYEALSNEFEIR